MGRSRATAVAVFCAGITLLGQGSDARAAAACSGACLDALRMRMELKLEGDQLKIAGDFIQATAEAKPCTDACSWDNLRADMDKCLLSKSNAKMLAEKGGDLADACEARVASACFKATKACDLTVVTQDRDAKAKAQEEQSRCDDLKMYCDQGWALYDEQKCAQFHSTCQPSEADLAEEEASRRKVQEEQESQQAFMNTVNSAAKIAVGQAGANAGGGSPSGTSYSGPYAKEVAYLLSHSPSRWQAPSCKNCNDGIPPAAPKNLPCVRDSYYYAALANAWAAESYARTGNPAEAADKAKEVRANLTNANQLCTNAPAVGGTVCPTLAYWRCPGW